MLIRIFFYNKMKVAIQGIKGSYHHQVVSNLYGDVALLECDTFDQLASAVSNGTASVGVMAIGNSIAGSILTNYGLINNYGLSINGEYYLNIKHHLMAAVGQRIEDIKEVQSHPMALLQCQSFFRKNPHIKIVETDDTAAAAYRIKKENKNSVAAIASRTAAHIYDLEILDENIQDVDHNLTRFIVVNKKQTAVKNATKATINFTTSHLPGSLGKVLTILGNHGINISKILSIPIVEQPFIFSFVADLEFRDIAHFENAQQSISDLVRSMKILGIYQSNASS